MAQNPSSVNTLNNVCSVYREMFSTSGGGGGGGVFSTLGGYHEYIGGYHEYIGDFMSALWGYHDACGGYHEYIEGCSVHWGFQYKLKGFCHLAPHVQHDIPQCSKQP